MYAVTLWRANGRFVKQLGRPYRSKYAAKQAVKRHEDTYDEKTYYITIEIV